MKLTPFKMV